MRSDSDATKNTLEKFQLFRRRKLRSRAWEQTIYTIHRRTDLISLIVLKRLRSFFASPREARYLGRLWRRRAAGRPSERSIND